MPELPEVETTKNDLKKRIVSRKIEGFWVGVPSRVFGKTNLAVNKTIQSLERRGKNIIINLSDDVSILIHQKISGHLLWGHWTKEKNKWVSKDKEMNHRVNSYIHFIVFLSDKKMVALSDPRKFFKVEINKEQEILEKIKDLGPDALEVSLDEFKKRIKQKKQIIKKLLLDQTFIAGVGNIYSDEALWQAKISPFRPACSLKDQEIKELYLSMRKILKKALELKGDSTSDYRLVTGEEGGYQKFHKVYQRDGKLCLRKDGGIIQREKFNNRSLRYCLKCQK